MNAFFVAYDRDSEPIARRIVAVLAERGLPVWSEGNRLYSADWWSPRIAKALESCLAFIAVLDDRRPPSIWMCHQYILARSNRRPIIQIRLGHYSLNDGLRPGSNGHPYPEIRLSYREAGFWGTFIDCVHCLEYLGEIEAEQPGTRRRAGGTRSALPISRYLADASRQREHRGNGFNRAVTCSLQ